jgi:beta-ring hydroxylase
MDNAAYVITVLVIVVTLLAVVFGKKRSTSITSVKGGLPFFGQMFIMLKGSPWDTMANWVKDYGQIYRIQLFGSDTIVVSDPALLKIIFATKLSIFKKDLEWTYKPFLVLLGNGLVTSDGDSWRKQRTLLANHLKFDILKDIPDMALKAVERLCVKLDKAKADGATIEMAEEFRHMTLQVIAATILSISPEESDKTFAHMYLPIVTEGNLRTWNPERMYLPTPAWFKFRRDVARLNNYVTSIIEKRWKLRKEEAASDKPVTRHQDVLDISLGAIPDEEWGPEVVAQLRDEVKTFILAGHETSASMLAWSLYELSTEQNSDLLSKVREEAAQVYAGHRDKTTGKVTSLPPRSELDKLVFADCCLRESLRKYSVVPTVVRSCSADTVLGEHQIYKGAALICNVQGVHHNPEYWPEPLVYRPDRFMQPPAPFTFLPFIDGPRMCLGQYLSLLESKVVLSTMLSRYRYAALPLMFRVVDLWHGHADHRILHCVRSFEVTNKEDAGLKHPFMVPIIPKTGHYMKVHDAK